MRLRLLLFICVAVSTLHAQDPSGTDIPASKNVKPFVGKKFPSHDGAHGYIHFDLIGHSVPGFYITQHGEKKECFIAYIEPEKLMQDEFPLLLYKHPTTAPVDYLNAAKDPNFDKLIIKKTVLAFYVGDQLFMQNAPGKWHILHAEGPVSEWVNITRTDNANRPTYVVSRFLQHLNGKIANPDAMALTFKSSMSHFVDDHQVLADKIRNRTEGYHFGQLPQIVAEYNAWYLEQNPGAVNYLFYEDGSIAWKKTSPP